MFISLGSNCAITYQLNKYNLRKISFLFDWCKININSLIDVFENNFHDYTKLEIIKLSDNFLNKEDKPTLVLTNKYNVKFAHEILEKYQLNDFSLKLNQRIDNLLSATNITFIRLEISPINDTYINKINKLVKLLDNLYDNYQIILILYKKIIIHPKVICYSFDEFSNDWKMNHLDWHLFFNSNV